MLNTNLPYGGSRCGCAPVSADHGQVLVVLIRILFDEGQSARQRGRTHVTREEEYILFLQQTQRVQMHGSGS